MQYYLHFHLVLSCLLLLVRIAYLCRDQFPVVIKMTPGSCFAAGLLHIINIFWTALLIYFTA